MTPYEMRLVRGDTSAAQKETNARLAALVRVRPRRAGGRTLLASLALPFWRSANWAEAMVLAGASAEALDAACESSADEDAVDRARETARLHYDM